MGDRVGRRRTPAGARRRVATAAGVTAALCLRYRYCGVVLGVFLITVSFWTVGYRITSGLYPWQVDLLTTGLISEEAAVVAQVVVPPVR